MCLQPVLFTSSEIPGGITPQCWGQQGGGAIDEPGKGPCSSVYPSSVLMSEASGLCLSSDSFGQVEGALPRMLFVHSTVSVHDSFL